MGGRRALTIAARTEFVSLLILLVNLATAHLPAITSLGGPVHGCAYLVVVILTATGAGFDRTARLRAWIPGIGGLLVLRLARSSKL